MRFVGMSGTLPHLADHIAMGVFDVFQIPYSAVEREHEAVDRRGAEGRGGHRHPRRRRQGRTNRREAGRAAVGTLAAGRLDDLLGGMTPMEFILRFTFTHPDLDTTIVGTINPAHLQTNLDILGQGPLPPDIYDEAKRRLAIAGSAPAGGVIGVPEDD